MREGRVHVPVGELLPILTAEREPHAPVAFRSQQTPEAGHGQKADDLLVVGLSDKINACCAGPAWAAEQRRVAIARAFMNDPELILADEPTGDLDEETRTR